MRALDLALKDLLQIIRDWKAAGFLVVMPIAFTLLFGFAFGGFEKSAADTRLALGVLDEDHSAWSSSVVASLENSDIVRLDRRGADSLALEKLVDDGTLAGALVVPAGYGAQVPLILIVDESTAAGQAVRAELQQLAGRLQAAARTARISVEAYERQRPFAGDEARQAYWDDAATRTLAAWEDPPISLVTNQAVQATAAADQPQNGALAHNSPGMMLQFAIAGLISAAEVLVLERKSRALQRLLTTPIRRQEILLGHFLAMFVMIFVQFSILIGFGQLALGLGYFRAPWATLLAMVATALMAASLGLLIGTLAKTEEQVIVFSLVPMFIFSGLGGTWVPLESTGRTFQAIGHLSPLAWSMDAFKGILLRGQGLEAMLVPAAALLGYALLFGGLAAWRFKFE